MSFDETRDQTGHDGAGERSGRPGLVLVVAAGKPCSRPLELPRSGLEIGRAAPEGVFEADERISRKHVSIRCVAGVWGVSDLGSRNGTFVNGTRVERYIESETALLIRIGNSLIWTVADVTPYLREPSVAHTPGSPVIGASLRKAWDEIAAASRAGDTLMIRGESGAGKELAARHLHELCFERSSTAPFIAVNCAAIPEGLAERLLFGAKRGAYSGAVTDARGYVAAADQGTLFLDEIAELDPLVQAKLLRVLETREVVPLGDSRAQSVRIRVVAATHKNLREEVSAGRFRQDLYFRVGRPEVVLPPLRARIDELPWLIDAELQRARPGSTASVGFVEACALRHWPGNVRELLREVRLAAHAPLAAGEVSLRAEHLAPDAGNIIVGAAAAAPKSMGPAPDEERIAAALREHQGNVTRAASALGLHRNQLRRWLTKHPVRSAEESGGD